MEEEGQSWMENNVYLYYKIISVCNRVRTYSGSSGVTGEKVKSSTTVTATTDAN
jgi:hypothetical protein